MRRPLRRLVRATPALRPLPALLVLLAPALAGCILQGKPDDLFPVCEDRRQSGPSPTYTLQELVDHVEVVGRDVTQEERRVLLEAVRERILTLQGAPYRRFDASLTLVAEGDVERWRFQARGTGGPDDARVEIDDAYDLHLAYAEGRARLEGQDASTRGPPATPTLTRLAWLRVNLTGEIDDVRARTPHLARSSVDPQLPACVFLHFEEAPPGEARSEIVVNLARDQVVHVEKRGW